MNNIPFACVQTSPISFVPFPRATKEIGDVCTQAIYHRPFLRGLFFGGGGRGVLYSEGLIYGGKFAFLNRLG